jgi:hypothetical protein
LKDDTEAQYTQISIDEESVVEGPQEESSAPTPLGDDGGIRDNTFKGVNLPPDISKGLAQQWLDQVSVHNKRSKKHKVPNDAIPDLDVRQEMSPRRR